MDAFSSEWEYDDSEAILPIAKPSDDIYLIYLKSIRITLFKGGLERNLAEYNLKLIYRAK